MIDLLLIFCSYNFEAPLVGQRADPEADPQWDSSDGNPSFIRAAAHFEQQLQSQQGVQKVKAGLFPRTTSLHNKSHNKIWYDVNVSELTKLK